MNDGLDSAPDSPADSADPAETSVAATSEGETRRPLLRAAVTYEHWTPEAFAVGDTDDRGFEQVATPTPLSAIIHETVDQYAMLPRDDIDLTRWWESAPFLNFRTGEETRYGLHLQQRGKDGDWKSLTWRNRERINNLLVGKRPLTPLSEPAHG